MNTVSDVLGNSGSPITVNLTEDGVDSEGKPCRIPDGRIIAVRKFTQADKTAIEQQVKAAARDQLMADRNEFADAEFQLAYGAFLDRVASADYKFGGRVFNSFLTSNAGGLHITRILCSCEGKPFTDDDVNSLAMDKPNWELSQVAVKQALAESFPKGQARI